MQYQGKKCGIVVTAKNGEFDTHGASVNVRVDYRLLDNPAEIVRSIYLTLTTAWQDRAVRVHDFHAQCNASIKRSLNKELPHYMQPIIANFLDFLKRKGVDLMSLAREKHDIGIFVPWAFTPDFYDAKKDTLEFDKVIL